MASLPGNIEIDISGLGLTWVAVVIHSPYVNFNYDPGSYAEQTPMFPSVYTLEKRVSGSLSTLTSSSSNGLQARVFLADVSTATNLKFTSTTDLAGGTTPSQLNIDIWDVSGCISADHTQLTCGVLTLGDSITASGLMLGKAPGSDVRPSLGDRVYSLTGYRTLQVNAGSGGWRSSTALTYISDYLAAFPFKYVTLNFGTNDAIFLVNPSVGAGNYYANMSALIQAVENAGRVAIVPKIPWCGAADVTPYNTQIDNLYTAYPNVIRGADNYSYFNAHQDEIYSGDLTHPTGTGYVSYNTLFRDVCVANEIY
jgi:lysophospholipase L1-like esterase